VGLATLIAGAVTSELGLERSYWAMAAATLMLHQGLDLVRTLQRGLERMLGTWAGLIIALGVISLHPAALWLAITLMALQFLVEIFVLRNYAIAVVFITPLALTIAAGGHAASDVHQLLIARGIDTILGCIVAFLVLMVTTPKRATVGLSTALRRAITAADSVLACLASGNVTSERSRGARRDLQHSSLLLLQAYDESLGASIRERDIAESFWPAVVASQRIAYRILSACWQTEQDGSNVIEETVIDHARSSLATIARSFDTGALPASNAMPAEFLGHEIAALHDAIATARSDS
jgi:uncharacterized membrane protein YccC